jgi:hypothetical protein
MVGKQAQSKISNSPVLRFKAAKNKFVKHESEKVLPIKRSSSYKIKRGNGMVHKLTKQFDKGPALVPKDIVSTTAKSFSSSASVASGTSSKDERPLLRTPQILGYKPKTCPNILQASSQDSGGGRFLNRPSFGAMESSINAPPKSSASQLNEITVMAATGQTAVPIHSQDHDNVSERSFDDAIPEGEEEEQGEEEDEECSDEECDESTFIAASVATLRQEDRAATPNIVEDDESYAEEDSIEEVLDKIIDAQSFRINRPNVIEEEQDQEIQEKANRLLRQR